MAENSQKPRRPSVAMVTASFQGFAGRVPYLVAQLAPLSQWVSLLGRFLIHRLLPLRRRFLHLRQFWGEHLQSTIRVTIAVFRTCPR
jgi:hypothetical protein